MARFTANQYWIEGMASWAVLTTPAPSISGGGAIYLGVGWQNDTTSPAAGSIAIMVSRPDGSGMSISPYANNGLTLDAGDSVSVLFGPIPLDRNGLWQTRATLTSGIASYSTTFDLANVSGVTPPPPGDSGLFGIPWLYVGAGACAGLILLGMRKK